MTTTSPRWHRHGLARAIQAAPVLLAFIVLGLPLWLLRHDMWDGVIIEHASDVRQYEGLVAFLVQSSWYAQYPLARGVIALAHAMQLRYIDVNRVVTMLAFVWLVAGTLRFARHRLRLTARWSAYMACMVVTFPVWHVLMSSVMTFHLLAFACAVWAVGSLHEPRLSSKSWQRVAWCLLLLPAYNLQSLLMFAPVFSYAHDLTAMGPSRSTSRSPPWTWRPSRTTLGVGALACVWYAVIHTWFPPSGHYAAYNTTLPLSLSTLVALRLDLELYLTYLGPLIIWLMVLTGLALGLAAARRLGLVGGSIQPIAAPTAVSSPSLRFQVAAFVSLIMMALAAVLPYAMVSKSATLFEVTGFVGRQALLLSLPAAGLTALSLAAFGREGRPSSLRLIAICAAASLLALQLVWLGDGMGRKLQRQEFEAQMARWYQRHADALPPGHVTWLVSQMPAPGMAEYESNAVAYRATGRNPWWTLVRPLRTPAVPPTSTMPSDVPQSQAQQLAHVYTAPGAGQPDCHTLLLAEVQHWWDGPWVGWSWWFEARPDRALVVNAVQALNVDVACTRTLNPLR